MWKVPFLVVCVLVSGSRAKTCEGDGCHIFQITNKLIRNFLGSQPDDLVIGDGVHLISNGNKDGSARSAEEGGILSTVENFLSGHEIRIRLPELMPGDAFRKSFQQAVDEFSGRDIGEGRKKDKGGGAGLMLAAMMMAKTLGAVGFGAVGLLAMKALMVASLALMLSAIIGIKKLASGGHEESVQVIHAGHGGGGGHEHYRKKREAAEMAYGGWTDYFTR